jgi:glycosyltransferase involved in cell wall biosynthesis
MALSYAVVTPARDEAANLARLADALLAQTVLPRAWVIVDDGSQDGTAQIAAQLAARHAWIGVVAGPGASPASLRDGLRAGRDLLAFRVGVAALDGRSDVVVKVDADVSFDPDYFERLLDRFAADPRLGMASGSCWELVDGHWRLQPVTAGHVRGASRAYRRECLSIVDALEPSMGWDGVDEIKAQVLGWRTATFRDPPFRHHRPRGERERNRLRAAAARGRGAWYMGYRPSFLVLRALWRLASDPGALGMVWGYAAAGAAGTPRCPDRDVVHAIRARQRWRNLLAVGRPH